MRVELRDGGDLKRLVRDLRQLDRQAAKELTSEFRGVLRPIVADVRAMYRALPAASRRRRPGRPLRSALASATRGQVRTGGMRQAGIRVAASGRRMPPGMGSLPSMVEGPPEGKVWRHPVHGDRQVWVTQPSPGRFHPTVRRHEDDFYRGAEAAVNKAVARFDRGR